MKKLSFLATIFLFPILVHTQNLEIDGEAKISVMNLTTTADSVVVRLSDGTLAVRDIASLPPDTDWTIVGTDMYNNNPGNVGIGMTTPNAKLQIVNDTAISAKRILNTTTSSVAQTFNIERTNAPGNSNDILEIKVPTGSPDNFQLVEFQRNIDVEFVVDGDGDVQFAGGLEPGGIPGTAGQVLV